MPGACNGDLGFARRPAPILRFWGLPRGVLACQRLQSAAPSEANLQKPRPCSRRGATSLCLTGSLCVDPPPRPPRACAKHKIQCIPPVYTISGPKAMVQQPLGISLCLNNGEAEGGVQQQVQDLVLWFGSGWGSKRLVTEELARSEGKGRDSHTPAFLPPRVVLKHGGVHCHIRARGTEHPTQPGPMSASRSHLPNLRVGKRLLGSGKRTVHDRSQAGRFTRRRTPTWLQVEFRQRFWR